MQTLETQGLIDESETKSRAHCHAPLPIQHFFVHFNLNKAHPNLSFFVGAHGNAPDDQW
jgi:hypothetical protein